MTITDSWGGKNESFWLFFFFTLKRTLSETNCLNQYLDLSPCRFSTSIGTYRLLANPVKMDNVKNDKQLRIEEHTRSNRHCVNGVVVFSFDLTVTRLTITWLEAKRRVLSPQIHRQPSLCSTSTSSSSSQHQQLHLRARFLPLFLCCDTDVAATPAGHKRNNN